MTYERRSRPAGNGTASTNTPSNTHSNRACLEWGRRRAATRRTPPYFACSCRDPWICRCYDGPVSDRSAEAAAAAIQHLGQSGLPGLLDHDTCKALWRVGYRDIAVEVQNRTQGLVA